MILPANFPYELHPEYNIPTHPFPDGADMALDEILVSVNKIENVIQFAHELWQANVDLYSRFTGDQALRHFLNLFFEWLTKYLPEHVYALPEYYPDQSILPESERTKLNDNHQIEEYWRIYRWIRWYSEAVILNIPEAQKTEMVGNVYIKILVEDLVKYFNDHHGRFYRPDQPDLSTFDKVKGNRHEWLSKDPNKLK
jgi:hypothetical protein